MAVVFQILALDLTLQIVAAADALASCVVGVGQFHHAVAVGQNDGKGGNSL